MAVLGDVWVTLVSAIGGIGVIAGGVGALVGKILASNLADRQRAEFNQRLEALKSHFAQELETAKAKLLSELQIQQIKFGALHQRRTEVLAEFYRLLEEAYSFTRIVTFRLEHQPGALSTSSAREAFHRCAEATAYFKRNKLLFSADLADKIESLLKTITAPSSEFMFALVSEASDEAVATAVKEWGVTKDQIPETLRVIESEFRQMLGSDALVAV